MIEMYIVLNDYDKMKQYFRKYFFLIFKKFDVFKNCD